MALSQDVCWEGGYYNTYVPPSAGETIAGDFFQFEIDCKNMRIPETDLELVKIHGPTYILRDSSDRKWHVELKREAIAAIWYGVASVTVSKDGRPLGSFRTASNTFYDSRDLSCVSAHGDAGFVDGVIDVSFSKQQALPVLDAVNGRGWGVLNSNHTEIATVTDAFVSETMCTREDACSVGIDVGPGVEFFAVSTLNGIGSGICASRIGAGAGAPPVQIVGLSLNTFADPSAPSPGQTATRLNERLLKGMFDQRVAVSSPRIAGRGNYFTISVLGPARALGISASTEYWYQANLAIAVGYNVHGGSLDETMTITLLDLIEIRAPEGLDGLPDGLIRSGRKLDYFDPITREFTADTHVMQAWSQLLATKVVEKAGGYVEGGGIYGL